ncbi:hypothetical protein ACE1ET_11285 [Saccharicrinis sp. FJH62]|uniref:hypothetical protein n=1 Tax=Saccharicrinis sp. FJH62 TaxID=3344657 RepID=UPI0035D40D83
MTSELDRLEDFMKTDLILSAVPELSKRAVDDPQLFNQLWVFVKRREPKLSWRSAWVLDHATEDHSELLDPILPEVYKELNESGEEIDGTIRHLMKFVLRCPVLEEEGGYLIDKCMTWLMTNDIPTAIRVHSLEYLYNIYLLMPEFKNELLSVIDANMEKGCSPGLMVRLKRVRLSIEKGKRQIG